jgi:hypothetical protein
MPLGLLLEDLKQDHPEWFDEDEDDELDEDEDERWGSSEDAWSGT